MPIPLLKELLNNQHIKYILLSHSPAYTAQEVAAAAHISGKQMAKVVMVKIKGQLAMVVLAAHEHVNFAALKQTVGTTDVDLASEAEFKHHFPGCEVGAMPPFGNLYDMPVYVSRFLTQQMQFVFNAGSHSELIQIAYHDFERLVSPKVIVGEALAAVH